MKVQGALITKYKDPGNAIRVTAPAGGVLADQAVALGGIFGVVNNDAAEGEEVDLWISGEYYLDNEDSIFFQLGDNVYWDPVGMKVSDKEDPGHVVIGFCSGEYTRAEAEVLVRLVGIAWEPRTGGGGTDPELEARVTQNEVDIAALTGRVTQNEGDISTLQSDLAALTSRVTQNEADITDLQEDVKQLQEIVVHLIPAAHGSMRINNVKSGSDFSGNRIINDYDVVNIPGDGVTLNASNGTMQFDFEGVWTMYFNFSLKHDKDSGDRLMELELWDLDDGDAIADAIFLYVPPDREGTAYCLALPIIVAASDVGNRWQWRIDGDDFSSIEWRWLSWGATYSDELNVVADPFPGR